MTLVTYLNRPLGSLSPLHKRQIYSHDSLAETFGVEHGLTELERLVV